MFCTSYGKSIADDSRFCRFCAAPTSEGSRSSRYEYCEIHCEGAGFRWSVIDRPTMYQSLPPGVYHP
jgi:hypothetical protein